MEMHQVRYFLAVCETLNFTRAAEQCNVAQPSLTRAIHKLEDELGGPLFRRERSRTHLTDLGRLMQPHLQTVQDAALSAAAEADDFQNLEKAPLHLGVMCTIGPLRMVGFLARLRRYLPSLDVKLHATTGKKIVDDLLSGEIDVALVGLPSYPERLDTEPLYSERYMIAFPKGHRYEEMPAVALRELDQEDYLQRLNCEYMEYFNELDISMPFNLNIRYSSESEDWIQALVLSGMGCSIMPEYLPALSGIAMRVLVEPEICRTVSLVTVAGRRFSPSVAALLRLARHYDWAS
jgi:DNA-binding transcriptional LysR family regulator